MVSSHDIGEVIYVMDNNSYSKVVITWNEGYLQTVGLEEDSHPIAAVDNCPSVRIESPYSPGEYFYVIFVKQRHNLRLIISYKSGVLVTPYKEFIEFLANRRRYECVLRKCYNSIYVCDIRYNIMAVIPILTKIAEFLTKEILR